MNKIQRPGLISSLFDKILQVSSNASLKQKRITPVFVVGAARNGTTQLTNAIGAHRDVAAVEHRYHHGSCESTVLLFKKQYGNLSDFDRYVEVVHTYSSEDYFKLAQGDVEFHLANRRDNFYDLFLDLMDRYAEKRHANFWVTKLDPFFFVYPSELQEFKKKLRQRYQKCIFIEIQRELKPSVKSYLNMGGQMAGLRNQGVKKYLSVILQTLRYNNIYKNEVLKSDLRVDFESLTGDKTVELNRIFKHLGLQAPPRELVDTYRPNSSFVGKKKSELNLTQKLLMNTTHKLFPGPSSSVTLGMIESVIGWRRPNYHRLIKLEYDQGVLKKELRTNQSTALLQELKSED